MKRKSGNDLTTQTLLEFDLGESSSDSDFRIEDHDDDSDDFSAGSKDGDDDDGKREGNGEDDSDNEDDEDSSDEDDDDDEDDEDEGSGSDDSGANLKNFVAELKAPPKLVEIKELSKVAQKVLTKPICCVCLGDRSDDANEIVECDGCGVTVHEGCYGVNESTSMSSTVSSCSTEPWFCEACKAGIEDPDCELCPNKGGIFKETDVGKWVHLVCALYVPGVAFGEVDQLSSVTLFEMAYNKWGAKTCCLCEDARFARTGVCIGCDAGMCKTYFHVTCAQYAGLLSETHTEEADQADPFYAHCKIHSDKTLMKHRKRNYNAIKVKTLQRKADVEARKLEKPSPEQVRIERKLTKHRKKYVIHQETKNPPWVPTQKIPRLLVTSATVCKKLLQKAELMGLDTAAMEFQEAQMASLADIRKKWHIPPAFSVEFIGYYLDRTVRLKDIKKNLQENMKLNKELLSEQHRLREKYDGSVRTNQDAQKRNEDLKEALARLYQHIHALCPSKALIPIEQIGKPPSVPPLQSPSVVINTPSSTPPTRTITVPTAAALKMGVGFPLQNLMTSGGKRDDTGRVLSTQCKQNSEELLNECGICKRCNDQHLLAKCDTCHLFYHLGCLNPPLTRHPKKSKLYGWQCSECDKSDDSGPESMILPKAPRKSRTRYSKDGTIVPYDMPSPELERPCDFPEMKKTRKNSGSSAANSPSKVNPSNGGNSDDMEAKEMKLEIPKIDPDLATKMNNPMEQAPTVLPAVPLSTKPPGAKRGRKKKIVAPVAMATALPSPPAALPVVVKEEPATKMSDVEKSPEPATVASLTMDCKKERKKDKNRVVPQVTAVASFHSNIGPIAAKGSSSATLAGVRLVTVPTEQEVMAEQLSALQAAVAAHHKHAKRRKEKHRNRSPNSDRPLHSKEHKRKRKRKNHDHENPNEILDPYSFPPADDSRPRIKIKIKSLPDGSNTHTIVYVPTDSIDPPARPVPVTSVDPLNATSSVLVKSPANVLSTLVASATPTVASPACISVVKSSSGRGRGRKAGGLARNSMGVGAASTNSAAANGICVCDVCHASGTTANIVQCDECHKNYHFGCLEPPLKKTPKRRGYSWHCAECDPTDNETI